MRHLILIASLFSISASAADAPKDDLNHWDYEVGNHSSINGVHAPDGYRMRMNKCDLSTPEKVATAQQGADYLAAHMSKHVIIGKSNCVIELIKIKP